MPAKRLSMRKIREVLRLKYECDRSNREIARRCLVSRSTVADYLLRFQAAGLCWPLPMELNESSLDRLLFPPRDSIPQTIRVLPDWHAIHHARGNGDVHKAMGTSIKI